MRKIKINEIYPKKMGVINFTTLKYLFSLNKFGFFQYTISKVK